MSREDAIKIEGTVVEALPNKLFRVALPNGHRVLARVPGSKRTEDVLYMPGEQVVVEMSPYDLSEGCITYRQK
ncbi:MAG: translation initiation factor IF-1 [Limisphaerales bacterium]